jgi:AAA ATPase domain
VGLRRERQAVLGAIQERELLLLLGPAGSGKTALVQSVLESEVRGQPFVYVSRFPTLHDLLVAIARELFRCGHRAFERSVKLHASERDSWPARQTSIHLKGLLWNALEQEPTTILLEGVDGASRQTYRFLQRLYFVAGMTFIVTSRDQVHLGELGRLFWDPRKTRHIHPLSETEARQLFEAAADHFGLRDLSIEDFREKALDSAKGNPGQIVEMCRLAANPIYVTGRGYVKFAPLRIDAMMRFL